MTALGIVLLVVVIAAVTLGLFAVAMRWARGRLDADATELRARLDGDERFLLEPAVGTYRGATARFSKVKGLSTIAVTDRRVMIVPAIGRGVELRLADVVGVEEARWFLRAYNGRTHLVLELHDGTRVGFQVVEHARWLAALREAIDRRAAAPAPAPADARRD